MLFSTIGQHWVFLWMLAAGALIGGWYALLAALRRLLRAGPWLSLAADAAFGLGAALLFCGALVMADFGRFRAYSALAAALGFALFALTVFGLARRLTKVTIDRFRLIFVKICRIRWIKVIFR